MNDTQKIEFAHNLNLSLINTKIKSLESLLDEEQLVKHKKEVSKIASSLKKSLQEKHLPPDILHEALKVIDEHLNLS